mmetsp:Transcript_4284/g.6300  ORF Transcript_4284/g.6300 Transcript_4284/m.6300 type:complete len:208 (+) Transcript_4284:31-654(+)
MSNRVKITMLGAASVGKTSMTVRFTQDTFDGEYDPTIEDTYKHQLSLPDGEEAELVILDTAGQEEYSVMRDTHWKESDAFMIVYDITNEASLDEIDKYWKKIQQIKDCDTFPVILCGNKCDLEKKRKVSKEDGEKYAEERTFAWLETSAKSNINVQESYVKLVELALSFDAEGEEESDEEVEEVKKTKKKKKKKKGLLKGLFKKKKK